MPAVELRDAGLAFGDRTLWQNLDLSVAAGEFVAVLGPNGSGKTSLLKVLLGQNHLTSGTASIGGSPVRRGQSGVGYVPQQRNIDDDLPLRGRDLVGRAGVEDHAEDLELARRKTLQSRLFLLHPIEREHLSDLGTDGDATFGDVAHGAD